MDQPSFRDIACLSMAEIAIGFVAQRNAPANLATITDKLTDWFQRRPEPGDVMHFVHRMMERGWLAPHDDDPGCYAFTDLGYEFGRAAFTGLSRCIDDGRAIWDTAIFYEVVRSTSTHEFTLAYLRRMERVSREKEGEDK